jgi:glycosyltransferase involved in cell wall biosynthesis
LAWKDYQNISDEVFHDYWKFNHAALQANLIKATNLQIEMAEKADHIVTVTEHAKALFTKCFNVPETKVHVIYNCARKNNNNIFDKVKVLKRLGLSENDKIILFSGRVVPKKGVYSLIDAFKDLSDLLPDCKLVLIGDGLLREALKAAIPKLGKIIITGHLNEIERNHWYSIATIGVLPTLAEQCSLSAIEMRFNNIPIVTTKIDGNIELFETGYDSILVDVDIDIDGERFLNHKLLMEAMYQLLTDDSIAHRISSNSMEKADSLFNLRKFGESYYNLLTNISNCKM